MISPMTSANSGVVMTTGMSTRGTPRELAREFESLMLSQLIKQMRQSGVDEAGLFPGDSSDSIGSLFDLHMSKHLASRGGFGVAESIEEKLGQLTGQSAGE